MNINRVTLTGNLTRDPELRALPSGTAVCDIGIAVNEWYKAGDGEGQERANYFQITVFGKQAENCSQYLSKGRPIAVDGRLRYEQWEKDGQKRSRVKIVADVVQFLNSGSGGGGGGGGASFTPEPSDVPADTNFGTPTTAGSAADDDIPFAHRPWPDPWAERVMARDRRRGRASTQL